MSTPHQEIKRLYELSKEIRERAQLKYVRGRQDEAMDDARYAEGIERAILEIAALNRIATSEMDELRILDRNEDQPPSSSDTSIAGGGGIQSETGAACPTTRLKNQGTRLRRQAPGIRGEGILR